MIKVSRNGPGRSGMITRTGSHTLTPDGDFVPHNELCILGEEGRVSLVRCPIVRDGVEGFEPVGYTLVLRGVR